MALKVIFFFGSVIFLAIFIWAANDVLYRHQPMGWQTWFMSSFTVIWFVFWSLLFRSRKKRF